MMLELPNDVVELLRARASREGRPESEVAVQVLREELSLPTAAGDGAGDLDWFFGSWEHDPEVDAALADMQRVHPDDEARPTGIQRTVPAARPAAAEARRAL